LKLAARFPEQHFIIETSWKGEVAERIFWWKGGRKPPGCIAISTIGRLLLNNIHVQVMDGTRE
jgi:hypothetical protein